MTSPTGIAAARIETLDPTQRGYVLLYRGPHTACPGCGMTNWWLGKSGAECGRCGCFVAYGERRAA